MCVCLYVCMCTYVCLYVCVYIRICVCMCMSHFLAPSAINSHSTHTHIYIYKHTHTHTHTHTYRYEGQWLDGLKNGKGMALFNSAGINQGNVFVGTCCIYRYICHTHSGLHGYTLTCTNHTLIYIPIHAYTHTHTHTKACTARTRGRGRARWSIVRAG